MTGPVELAVIVPTFNERANVAAVAERVAACLDGVAYELIFVDDDSPDGTADAVRALAQADGRVRCLQRIGRRGLSSACIEGMLASSAPYLAVMDADLQHDETLLPRMLAAMREDSADIVVGSRYTETTEVPGWNRRRVAISRLSTWLAHRLLRAEVSDPMSGFFMLRRETFQASVRDLSGIGFKILLDLLASTPEPVRVRELPYRFRTRLAGESKLDARAAQDFLMLLLDKTVGRWVPPRFILFAAVGGLGLFVHLAVLALLLKGLGVGFVASQSAATLVAITFNFALNNELTFRDRRLTGRRWFAGLLSFAVACSVGAFANVGIAAELFDRDTGWILSALGGILVGAVWNYAVTSFYTWNRPKTR
jgi:dolichol-phosphate mannosyltransferase